MEANNANNQADTNLRACKSGCGFFGFEYLDGLCFECFYKANPNATVRDVENLCVLFHTRKIGEAAAQERRTRLEIQIRGAMERARTEIMSEMQSRSSMARISNVGIESGASSTKTSPLTKKCSTCGKQGIMLFNCRCGKKFCSSHRYAEGHECSFKYKEAEQNRIANENAPMRSSTSKKME